VLGDDMGAVGLTASKIGLCRLQRPQTFFPLPLETARHEPVLGVDDAIAPFCALGFVMGAFHGKSPLLERRLAIGFKSFRGGERRGQFCGFQSSDERPGYGVVDLDAADIEAVDASVLEQHFASTVIAW